MGRTATDVGVSCVIRTDGGVHPPPILQLEKRVKIYPMKIINAPDERVKERENDFIISRPYHTNRKIDGRDVTVEGTLA